ncbi:electron transfer flavoprotein subunit alpha/FixB family protein [Desulfovibrio sp. JC010]|uniref:electron transfer flavoprotein subunit alpha/FixB family protein n=1 Tax=Desulfovibrio sp. JC010 TaxID=2593641 RepID=UPI0013D10A5D|nr:electron transfer flavoprotein subunit alpha/FixB family protein [Desulfovibrio sp. JC010]NDV26014.1 electron transfer flavoprotein subunit alpha/FixB family protein [Desulfovibrio sp. JC010]
MKVLLIAEQLDGVVSGRVNELCVFAEQLGAEQTMFASGDREQLPSAEGRLYFFESNSYAPDVHKEAILKVVAEEQPDMVVFLHSSYGWDLAPRVACAMEADCVSGVAGLRNGKLVVPVYNGKLQREVELGQGCTVVTLQPGAFPAGKQQCEPSEIITVHVEAHSRFEFLGYEDGDESSVDLGKAEVVVAAGRGVLNDDSLARVKELAAKLGGEHAATRPLVDAQEVENSRQIGITGQSIQPAVYIACGISGAVEHSAGARSSKYVIAVNTDLDAPIRDLADVLVVADANEFLPLLLEKI